MNKPINQFQITGSVSYKAYYKNEKRLVFGVSVSVPRMFGRRNDDSANFIRDFPRFSMTGDEAEKLDAQIDRGVRLTVTGHLETLTRLRYEGHSMYRQTYELTPVVENIYFDAGSMNGNTVNIAGEIIRVYRNPDEGKRFYMITVSAPVNENNDARITFMHFDKTMNLEPKVGDFIVMNGVLQTRIVEQDVERGGRTVRARITQMSVVSRTVAINRKEVPKKDNESNPIPVENDSDNETQPIPETPETDTETNSIPEEENTEEIGEDSSSDEYTEDDNEESSEEEHINLSDILNNL